MCPGYLKTACCNFADIEHFELWPLKGTEKTRHIKEKNSKLIILYCSKNKIIQTSNF